MPRRSLIIILALLPLCSTLLATPAVSRFVTFTPAQQSHYPERYEDCGFAVNGAQDSAYLHEQNRLRRKATTDTASHSSASLTPQAKVEDIGEIAVIEDDGSIIVPPNDFDLQKKALLFTPQDAGYGVTRISMPFDGERGEKLKDFVGLDGQSDNNNGFREVPLPEASFPFFGLSYDRLFVSANGYITFSEGDTASRPSPAHLASGAPRIAPLWWDFFLSGKGAVYYKRAANRHVFTWNKTPQIRYAGLSTFQTILFDDGRIAFIYKKINAHAGLVGLSTGDTETPAVSVDLSAPPATTITGAVYEAFSQQKRLDDVALARAFYRTHTDVFDTLYIWTDFAFDNGTGLATAFNVRNEIRGIGMPLFDRGAIYGSPAQLQTIIRMGNIIGDWPADPNAQHAGLHSAIAIVCHEQGHRWLAYVRFADGRKANDDLLGREREHWSFLTDSRTNAEGSLSSIMEGNAWRDIGAGIFMTTESAAHHFSKLDQYLMGLRASGEVGEISYLDLDDDLQELVRSRSPLAGFSLSARPMKTTIEKIIAQEGERVPDVTSAPKQLRVAFVLLTEAGRSPSQTTLDRVNRYREAQERYFAVSTGRRAALDSSLAGSARP